jgi:hypothetical protein
MWKMRVETSSHRRARPDRLVSDAAVVAVSQPHAVHKDTAAALRGWKMVRSLPTQKECEAHHANPPPRDAGRGNFAAELDHLTLAYFIVREYETPKLTVILQKIGSLTGMWLFSLCFYYGLARLTTRLVMWAASLLSLTLSVIVNALVDGAAAYESARQQQFQNYATAVPEPGQLRHVLERFGSSTNCQSSNRVTHAR